MFNPAKAADDIKKEYIGYISTTYHFKNQKFQQKFEEELWNTVSKGPFVEIKDSFKSGKSIEELIEEGILSPLFRDMEKNKTYPSKLPLERPLYLHQEKAIRKIVKGRNVVVSTGTGSGKTHCFLIPVINELLREKELGTLDSGVRAIFIYPMNALANDQIKGLREILMSYPDIRFGVYNGGTEQDEESAIRLYKAMYENEKYPELKKPLPNEALSRAEMKKNPPHILFTNYAMLEHMLLRPDDDTIFSNSNFKFVVLDEAHVYTGATGIETSFLMGRLKGRMASEKAPQFILTSATLGDGSEQSNYHVVEFAQQLTGCQYDVSDIVCADRENPIKKSTIKDYPINLFFELSDEKLFFDDVMKKYGIQCEYSPEKEPEILFELISSSKFYSKMREKGELVLLDNFSKMLGISQDEAVAFVALCAKARKNGKALIDIRYHFFLRALDGCHIALDYPESLSLVRKSEYKVAQNKATKMFEIAVCEDCGEIAIVGKIENDKLVRASEIDELQFFQVQYDEELYEEDEPKKNNRDYVLCKNCGAITPIDEVHNKWCDCGNKSTIRVVSVNKDKCLNCNGTLRRFNLGYDAATGVIATSLYEHIPESRYEGIKTTTSNTTSKNIFARIIKPQKNEVRTGSQFLVFSDSRQGAAKFACSMNDMYKQFLRRRGVWNVLEELSKDDAFDGTIGLGDFVKKLENYFSKKNMFRKNAKDMESSPVENRRNAWIAVLDELYKCNRSTSLVSLGRLSFEYMGNSPDFIDAIVDHYKVSEDDARNFLNFLAFEVVRTGAVITDGESNINDVDREYLFFSPYQKVITEYQNNEVFNSEAFVPSSRTRKDGVRVFYKSRILTLTKRFLNIEDSEAEQLIDNYWQVVLVGDSDENPYALVNNKGQGYCIKASSFKILFGEKARLWKCQKCGKVTQFNMNNKCCQINCDGELKRLDSNCQNNYYAMLYRNSKTTPLFIKEHTAQLAKKDALDYQQQFIRKEINALSCSTTFEMGVDVGDLETVFLRNIPPLPSNYAQRVGRAGRSIDAAAFAVTYARLSSHDFNFYDNPEEMIHGRIMPPNFNINNEKILKRHVYAIALGLYLKENPELYSGNKADKFINDKGYKEFVNWLKSEPKELTDLLKKSILNIAPVLKDKYLDSYQWTNDFCGETGQFTKIIDEFEQNVKVLQKEINRAKKEDELKIASMLQNRLERYQKNDFIDFLVRGNILPKYGFPIDSVELTQNIASKDSRTLNLTRDLSVAISEYAPSSEIVADGGLYTSRYIRKPIVNKTEQSGFETAWIAKCPTCDHTNYSNVPIGKTGRDCVVCGQSLKYRDFHESIEPRAGFIAEQNVKPVPLTSQEKKYRTEALYIGDKEANTLNTYKYSFNGIDVEVESTTNDSLVVISTDHFFVCPKCGYAIAGDETGKLEKYSDYNNEWNSKIGNDGNGVKHPSPFGKGDCDNTKLIRYGLHHEFKTDVAKISFNCDTSDYETMLSVMYALLNAFANELNIERRDIQACLVRKKQANKDGYQIIIYDAVPGGAGHSRRLVTEDGEVFRAVIRRAVNVLQSCTCSPSCYRCLRSYDNQRVHERLNRENALQFFNVIITPTN